MALAYANSLAFRQIQGAIKCMVIRKYVSFNTVKYCIGIDRKIDVKKAGEFPHLPLYNLLFTAYKLRSILALKVSVFLYAYPLASSHTSVIE